MAIKWNFLLRVFKQVLKEGIPCKLYMVGSSQNPALNVEIELAVFDFTGRNLYLEYTGDADLNMTASGNITVMATGTITATNVVSLGEDRTTRVIVRTTPSHD